MDFIKEKIKTMTELFEKLKRVNSVKVDYEYVECPEYKVNNIPPQNGWKKADDFTQYYGYDTHYWIKFRIEPLFAVESKQYRLSVRTGREGLWDAGNPQFTVYVNGETVHALDTNHTWFPLEYEKEMEVYMYLHTGSEGGKFYTNIAIDTIDTSIENFYYDIKVPYLCMCELSDNDYNYIRIRDCLNIALTKLDLREKYSSEFYDSIEIADKFLMDEFYNGICGETDSVISCVGHTHIDIAWLWTIAQTREKAQRSFSTMLSLINQYDDFIFMSSQPILYQFVKENDLKLYNKIKEAVAKGKWEVEGGMWLEADTNLISGESLIRQILYGKKFMKEEFGVNSTILWLPDVFGYSAALPQILKKSGITQFFTTKILWNDTNSMPHDTFIWEGIDGSSVFASFANEYNKVLNPHFVLKAWDDYKDKSYSNEVMIPFGHADGGGGPTYEMLETHKRMKYGIPGMPKTEFKSVKSSFANMENTFIKNANNLKKLPKWHGELYLEMHRGTYTSMAENKRYNRMCEILYHTAESLLASSYINNICEYPAEMLRKNYEMILLNQFHDIIPGSSIKEVYDLSKVQYESILQEGRELLDEVVERICSNIKTNGGLFIYNPTSFVISDYITHEGKTYFADKIPSYGWKVIDEIERESQILVDRHSIDNNLIRVEFDQNYNISCVYDKEINRNIIVDNEVGNVLEVYEDYPRDFDAWEISDYYVQKKWTINSVEAVEILDDGIRVIRTYKNSRIIQDIVVRKDSKRIDFKTYIDWNEDHVLLKAAFPVNIKSDYATYDIQFGNVQRNTYQNNSWDEAKFEVCAHKWADISETNYGVSLLNDCKYGYSINENVMRITLLKAATFPNPEADRGEHWFTYSLFPHIGGVMEGNTIREGYLLNTPLMIKHIDSLNGTLNDTYSFVNSSEENIIIETIKKAEDDDSIIFRLYEPSNQKTYTSVKFGFDVKKAFVCDMMENCMEELNVNDNEVSLQFSNYEIITLKIYK